MQFPNFPNYSMAHVYIYVWIMSARAALSLLNTTHEERFS
jgi:hypothetical protein